MNQQVTHAELLGACCDKRQALLTYLTDVMEGVGIGQAYALIKQPQLAVVALPQEDDSIIWEDWVMRWTCWVTGQLERKSPFFSFSSGCECGF